MRSQHPQPAAKPQQVIWVWNLVDHHVLNLKLEEPPHHASDGDEDEGVERQHAVTVQTKLLDDAGEEPVGHGGVQNALASFLGVIDHPAEALLDTRKRDLFCAQAPYHQRVVQALQR